jgi:phosphopantetheine--protein transferase-like protein
MIGIDIENQKNFPSFKEEGRFYKDNFSNFELAYAKEDKNKIKTLVGFFAIKEAIVKADNYYKSIPFKSINIRYKKGIPTFNGFEISISYSKDICIAVAIKKYK